MYITQQKYPLVWEKHKDLSITERILGFEIPDELYRKFRGEAEATMGHLSEDDKTVWAIYNAHMHPGMAKDVQIPEIAEQNSAPHSTAGLPKVLDAAMHLITAVDKASTTIADAVASDKVHTLGVKLDPITVASKTDLSHKLVVGQLNIVVEHHVPSLDAIVELFKPRASNYKKAALVALWAIVFLLLFLASGIKLHAQTVTIRGVPLGTTTASNTTVTAACIANHNCLDIDLLNIPHIICDSGCGGAASFSDNSAFTVGTTAINVIGAYYTSGSAPTLSSGNAGRVRMDANSYLYTDCVVGCSGGSTTPADGFSNPTTAGLSFDLLAGFNGTTWDRLRDDTNKYLYVDVANSSLAVTGTFYQATQPVSIASGQVASGAIASGAVASGAYASGSIASGAIVDGGDVALGTTTVAKSTATDTTSVAVIPLLKEVSYMEQNPVSRAVTNAGTFPTQSAITAASGSIASGALASGSIASGACASGCVADGGITTMGAKTDAKNAATDTTSVSQISILKEISSLEQAPASRAVTNGGTFAVQASPASGVFEVGPTASANTLSNQFFAQLTNGTNGQTFMSTTTSSKFGADMNILAILGTAPTTAGFLDIKGADGNVFVRQTTGSNLHAVIDTGSTTAVTGVVETGPTTSANTAANAFFHQIVDAAANPMGTMTNFGSTPSTAKSLNANVSLFIGTVAASNKSSTISTGTVDVNLVGSLGSTMSATNPIFSNLTDGTNALSADMSAYGTAPTGTKSLGVNAFVTGTSDPCSGPKKPQPFSLASTTSLALVTAVASQYVHICSLNIVSASAENVVLIEGTKTSTDCDTSTAGMAGGTTAATGWNIGATGGLTIGGGTGTVFETASAAHEVCLLSSGSTQLSGSIMYVQTTIQ